MDEQRGMEHERTSLLRKLKTPQQSVKEFRVRYAGWFGRFQRRGAAGEAGTPLGGGNDASTTDGAGCHRPQRKERPMRLFELRLMEYNKEYGWTATVIDLMTREGEDTVRAIAELKKETELSVLCRLLKAEGVPFDDGKQRAHLRITISNGD